MTGLNLTPLVATVPLGDNEPIVVRRWMLVVFAPMLLAAWGYTYTLDGRVAKLEAAPLSNVVLEQRLERLEKVIDGYEQLKMQREREIATLSSKLESLKEATSEINGKLDRLLFGRR